MLSRERIIELLRQSQESFKQGIDIDNNYGFYDEIPRKEKAISDLGELIEGIESDDVFIMETANLIWNTD